MNILPLTIVAIVAAILATFGFHQEDAAGAMMIVAFLNEAGRWLAFRPVPGEQPMQSAPVARDGVTLIPNRERTPIGDQDG